MRHLTIFLFISMLVVACTRRDDCAVIVERIADIERQIGETNRLLSDLDELRMIGDNRSNQAFQDCTGRIRVGDIEALRSCTRKLIHDEYNFHSELAFKRLSFVETVDPEDTPKYIAWQNKIAELADKERRAEIGRSATLLRQSAAVLDERVALMRQGKCLPAGIEQVE